MTKFASLIAAATLAQMVLVPTPGGQYDNGRNSYTVMPQVYTQPQSLPQQFGPPQFNMGQGLTPMTRPQPVMPRPVIQ